MGFQRENGAFSCFTLHHDEIGKSRISIWPFCCEARASFLHKSESSLSLVPEIFLAGRDLCILFRSKHIYFKVKQIIFWALGTLFSLFIPNCWYLRNVSFRHYWNGVVDFFVLRSNSILKYWEIEISNHKSNCKNW